ncbi:response regulator transcription factor [Frankia sp. CNm7]|uniref:Response regulator transcription factor n=1 Tax=Frankia nepalensis TaxID=1836974 RepID=A0A937RM23_9ACTN|nr:response regulator transcription factor [Frankia nepalensis]MBL7500407.1 response regulator transcription factor [Frankia nepalensis]MBL7508705.1 response regulator transcription factor [Frankia nepalensis]MBL7520661.1 response regulator transcription factor [Frankia nepalensis]MBL7628868.1 response regulator transcription factor [Frankia nepalensis]
MRVAIAEDSGMIRKALELLLHSIGSEVVISVSTGQELLISIENDLSDRPPDVAIVDMRMPPTRTDEGLRTALLLKEEHPLTGVLVVTAHADDPFGADLIETGLAGVGYMRKDNIADGPHLKDALDRLAAGELVVDHSITAALLCRESSNNRLNTLSEREREILGLMAQGRSNAGIARLVHLSPKTVEARIANIFLKLRLGSDQTYNRRVLAVLEWLRTGNVMVDLAH